MSNRPECRVDFLRSADQAVSLLHPTGWRDAPRWPRAPPLPRQCAECLGKPILRAIRETTVAPSATKSSAVARPIPEVRLSRKRNFVEEAPAHGRNPPLIAAVQSEAHAYRLPLRPGVERPIDRPVGLQYNRCTALGLWGIVVAAARELTAGTAAAQRPFRTIPVVRAGCAQFASGCSLPGPPSLAILQIPSSTTRSQRQRSRSTDRPRFAPTVLDAGASHRSASADRGSRTVAHQCGPRDLDAETAASDWRSG